MKSFFVNLYETFARFGEPACKARVRQELLMHSESMLEEMGFDRAKLISGIEAWPWRLEESATKGNVTTVNFKKDAAVNSDTDNLAA